VKIAYSDARFSPDARTVYCTSDRGGEQQRLLRLDVGSKAQTWMTPEPRWAVESFELSPDGRTLAVVSNEDGVSVLRLLDTKTARVRLEPKLPQGVITGLEWHQNGRDLRRAEYGDERDPAMRAYQEKISPLNHVAQIRVPLLVVQGRNDPRVPVTEAEQMVRALRAQGGTCAYLMARDEGHGFAKKKNADFQFLSTVLFQEQHLADSVAR